MCTSSCISLLSSFGVKELCSLFSDAHNRFEFDLKNTSASNSNETSVDKDGKHKRWVLPKEFVCTKFRPGKKKSRINWIP